MSITSVFHTVSSGEVHLMWAYLLRGTVVLSSPVQSRSRCTRISIGRFSRTTMETCSQDHLLHHPINFCLFLVVVVVVVVVRVTWPGGWWWGLYPVQCHLGRGTRFWGHMWWVSLLTTCFTNAPAGKWGQRCWWLIDTRTLKPGLSP